MRILPLTTIVLLVGAGYALAQGTPNSTMSSGRPSAVLTDAQCQEVWKKAVPSGDTLAQADAAPYIVNFTQVDTRRERRHIDRRVSGNLRQGTCEVHNH